MSGILATRHWTHWSVTKLQPDMSRVSSAASWGPQPVKAAWQTAVYEQSSERRLGIV